MTTVSRFYKGVSVLVTGATGFIGKALVSKLLRHFPEVDEIFLLIRSQKEETPEKRLVSLINDKVLMATDVSILRSKLHPICGDLRKAHVGISVADRQLLKERVNLVFHCAATTSFSQSLKDALTTNTLGTQRLLQLSTEMDNLKGFVHTSSVAAHTCREQIEENLYPTPVDPDNLLTAVCGGREGDLRKMTSQLQKLHPNTYSLSKFQSECLLELSAAKCNFSISIVRPSVTGSAWRDPKPGWVQGFLGAGYPLAEIGLGRLRYLGSDPRCVFDLVPVDLVVNTMIAVGWATATQRPGNIAVYNVGTSDVNPITMEDLFRRFPIRGFEKHPLSMAIRRPEVVLMKESTTLRCRQLLSHQLPAGLHYIFTMLSRGDMRSAQHYLKMQSRVVPFTHYLSYNWNACTANTRALMGRLDPEDKQVLFYDIGNLKWEQYVEDYCRGIKDHLFKDY